MATAERPGELVLPTVLRETRGPAGGLKAVDISIRPACDADLDTLRGVFRHASLSHEGDRAHLLDSPQTRLLAWLHQVVWPDVTTDLYDGLRDLPPFTLSVSQEPEAVRDLLDRVAAAEAVLFCTLAYSGGLPGSLKNLLDWPMGGSLEDKPVAWVDDLTRPGHGATAHVDLRAVLTNLGAHPVEPACQRLTPEDTCLDPSISEGCPPAGLVTILATVARRSSS